MSAKLCCNSAVPYKPIATDYERYFKLYNNTAPSIPIEEHIIQLARQQNFGKLLDVKFFNWNGNTYEQIEETDVIKHEFTKINSFKNFVCKKCNLFFEINLYLKNGAPRASHHWRYNINRLNEIDSIQ